MVGYQMAPGPLARQKKIGQQAAGVNTAAPGLPKATNNAAPTVAITPAPTAAPKAPAPMANPGSLIPTPRPGATMAAGSSAAPGMAVGGGGGYGVVSGPAPVPWGSSPVTGTGGQPGAGAGAGAVTPLSPPNPASTTTTTGNTPPLLLDWIKQQKEEQDHLKTPITLDPQQLSRDILGATVPIANTYARGYSRGNVASAQRGTGSEGADLNAQRNNELQKGEQSAAIDATTDKDLQRVFDANQAREGRLLSDTLGSLPGYEAPSDWALRNRAVDQGDFSNLLSYQRATNDANSQEVDIEKWLAQQGIGVSPGGVPIATPVGAVGSGTGWGTGSTGGYRPSSPFGRG